MLAKDELRRLSQRAKGPDADILLFQIALLEDESFTNEIGDYIAAGAGGAAAVERAEQIFAGRLKTSMMSTSGSAASMSATSAAAWWIFWTDARAAACI